jgi:hypothetical protein
MEAKKLNLQEMEKYCGGGAAEFACGAGIGFIIATYGTGAAAVGPATAAACAVAIEKLM